MSGALVRHIRKWVCHFNKDELEFFALFMPKEPWKRLADILHLNPKKDFPQCMWFLPYCFGENAPPDSLVSSCGDITAENVSEMV